MKRISVKVWTICLLTAGCMLACAPQETQTGDLNVIPLPQEVTENPSSAPFVIKSSTTIVYDEGNEKLASTARLLADYIKEVTGTEVKTGTKAGKNSIMLKIDSSIPHKDGYELKVTTDAVTVTGATEAGVSTAARPSIKHFPSQKARH